MVRLDYSRLVESRQKYSPDFPDLNSFVGHFVMIIGKSMESLVEEDNFVGRGYTIDQSFCLKYKTGSRASRPVLFHSSSSLKNAPWFGVTGDVYWVASEDMLLLDYYYNNRYGAIRKKFDVRLPQQKEVVQFESGVKVPKTRRAFIYTALEDRNPIGVIPFNTTGEKCPTIAYQNRTYYIYEPFEKPLTIQ